jgi:signal transduction histidine kinase
VLPSLLLQLPRCGEARSVVISIKDEAERADSLSVDQHSAVNQSRSVRGRAWRHAFGIVPILLVVAVVAIAAAISLSFDAASRDDIIAQAIRLSVTLFIPAVMMIAYWFIVQRQVRTAKADLNARLDSGQGLIARVSHQLRDQLTVIYGFSEALLDSDMNDQAEVRDIVTIINTEALDLSRVVDDLVSAAELEAGEFNVSFSRFDPSVEVERVVLPFRRRGHEISIDCWSGTALSDPIRFRQVVRALLSNATAHGGPTVGFVGELSNGSFLCTVVDDGDGMGSLLEGQFFASPTDDAPRASEAGGAGLGLTVSHAVVDQLGGNLTYERSADLTMVTMALPTKDWPKTSSPTDMPSDADWPEGEVADDADAATKPGKDPHDVAEPESDIDSDRSEMVIALDAGTSETDWSVSFDEEDEPESDAVDDDDNHDRELTDEEDDDPAEEAEAVVEVSADS